ncbi:hypothetical protein A3B01_02315 [Candidatus Nomurabacteria bacterium RIFCSPLOWO2_01_FULL_41_52b]|nr:MAG: hypothetical protein A3B01_02315 [Candidatus Nomurabacteria bacterium RIFCSPLOWO2_01_FULL_41_52b]
MNYIYKITLSVVIVALVGHFSPIKTVYAVSPEVQKKIDFYNSYPCKIEDYANKENWTGSWGQLYLQFGEQANTIKRLCELEALSAELERKSAQLQLKIDGLETQVKNQPISAKTETITVQDNSRVEALEQRVSLLERAVNSIQNTVLGAINKAIGILDKLLGR